MSHMTTAEVRAFLKVNPDEEREYRELMYDPWAAAQLATQPAAQPVAQPVAQPAAQPAGNHTAVTDIQKLAQMLAKKKQERSLKREVAPLGDATMLSPAEKDIQYRLMAKSRRKRERERAAQRSRTAKAKVKKVEELRWSKPNVEEINTAAIRRLAAKKQQEKDAQRDAHRDAQRDAQRAADRERQQRHRMALAMRDPFETDNNGDELYDFL